jgi:parallel beta-helix repeat protein
VLDNGKLGDGPSNRNLVVGNIVRNNRRVGISIDGSGDNRVSGNRVSGQPIGIRLSGRSLSNLVTRNDVSDATEIGIFVDRPAAANAIVGNRIHAARVGVRIRGAADTLVRANRLLATSVHGVTVDGSPDGGQSGRTPAPRLGLLGGLPRRQVPDGPRVLRQRPLLRPFQRRRRDLAQRRSEQPLGRG